MAKVTAPLFSLSASKTVARLLTFQKRGSGHAVYKYTKPGDVKPFTPSASQVDQRTLIKNLDGYWAGFDEGTKGYYNQLKYPPHMSGINRYIRLYTQTIPAMIVYWETLEHNASDTIRIPDYVGSEYFGGVKRLSSVTSYPATPPYGSIRYRSDLKKFIGFKEDAGWSDLGGVAAAVDFLVNQVFT